MKYRKLPRPTSLPLAPETTSIPANNLAELVGQLTPIQHEHGVLWKMIVQSAKDSPDTVCIRERLKANEYAYQTIRAQLLALADSWVVAA